MIYITTSQHDENDIQVKIRALRNAVICLGWLKIVSVAFYLCLFFLVRSISTGEISNILQILILFIIPFEILHGTVLFIGAVEEKKFPLEFSLWLCLVLASYNTFLGLFGSVYFIRTGKLAVHFLLAIVFGMLGLSICTVLCHDVLIIYAYKELLYHQECQRRRQRSENPPSVIGEQPSCA